MHGSGVIKYADGESYSGQFADGRRNGEGTNIFSNGTVLDGLWLNDEFVIETCEAMLV
jgi:hypothetical protein